MQLDEADVRAVITWGRLIPAMEAALAAFSAGRIIQPVPSMVTVEEGRRCLGVMPAASDDAMGLKLVSFYPANRGTVHPTHLAMILLLDPATGQPLALMDGRLITEMRTAAVSAAVTRRLASPDSRVLALLGSGVQAKAHLEALSEVLRFDEVRVWSRTPEHARRFAAEHGARALDAEAAVRGADVVVTTTNGLEPILKGAWLKLGAHVNAVGSPRPTWRELDDDAMRSALCGGLARGGAQGVRRRHPLPGADLRRGRGDLRGLDAAAGARGDDGVQVRGDRGRGPRRRASGLRCGPGTGRREGMIPPQAGEA